MLISESGLARRLKFAYRHTGGYTVYNDGDNMMVYTEMWLVRAQRQLFPRKALGVIVEHIGDLPDAGVAIYTAKDTPPQDVFSVVAREDAGGWMCGDRGAQVTMAPVVMQGAQVFQPRGGGECWGCPVGILEVINWGDENMPDADVVGADRLLWEVPGETVVITALRKAVQATVREWERADWSALEGIDLHKEDGRC